MQESKHIKLSIIIPCYNDGKFIKEAISSVEKYTKKSDIEIIIVNDGSKDTLTLDVLKELESKGYFIINQENKGLGAARNNGIRAAKGDYFLPLDCDNKIIPEYIKYGIQILDSLPDIGVVYGNSLFFGDENKINVVPEFNIASQFLYNFIDACAVIRKSAWLNVNGYDETMRLGYEDWDFWISLAEKGWEFHHVDEVLFEYRIRNDSMVVTTRKTENHDMLQQYMCQKHLALFRKSYTKVYEDYRTLYLENKQKKKLLDDITNSRIYIIFKFLRFINLLIFRKSV